MARNKRSFFERITGGMNVEPEADFEEAAVSKEPPADDWADDQNDAQLTVDVYQTPTEIVLQAMVAGVKPEDLEVNITREMVTIKGMRHKHNEVREEDFFSRELYWGAFSRAVLLPQEVEVEKCEAAIKHGLLTIRMPKVNKEKSSNLKVKLL